MQRRVEAPLVAAGALQGEFVNSAALNVYHDGSEGIQSHFDDASRFERPIVSLRLFSDSRLSFGTQLYGWGIHFNTINLLFHMKLLFHMNFHLSEKLRAPRRVAVPVPTRGVLSSTGATFGLGRLLSCIIIPLSLQVIATAIAVTNAYTMLQL